MDKTFFFGNARKFRNLRSILDVYGWKEEKKRIVAFSDIEKRSIIKYSPERWLLVDEYNIINHLGKYFFIPKNEIYQGQSYDPQRWVPIQKDGKIVYLKKKISMCHSRVHNYIFLLHNNDRIRINFDKGPDKKEIVIWKQILGNLISKVKLEGIGFMIWKYTLIHTHKGLYLDDLEPACMENFWNARRYASILEPLYKNKFSEDYILKFDLPIKRPPTHIRSQRLTYELMELTRTDAKNMFNLINRQSDSHLETWGKKFSYCGIKEKLFQQQSKKTPYFGIYKDNELIGLIGLRYQKKYFLEKYNKKYWIALLIDENYKGKGYGIESADRFMQYIEENRIMNEIFSGVYPDNTASIRIWEKLGFQHIDTARNGTLLLRWQKK